MSQIKYLLDEHVDPDLRKGIKIHWPDIEVWCIGDPGAPGRSTLDPDILLWCEHYGVTLVTNNRTSMPVHLAEHLAAGHYLPGIFVLGDHLSMGEMILDLGVVWAVGDPREYENIISYMPVSFKRQP